MIRFFFDTETTGLIAGHHEIISFGYIITGNDLEPLEEGEFFALPEHEDRIEPGAVKTNGYTKELWQSKGATTQAVLRARIEDVLTRNGLRRARPAGHNVKFDIGFLQALINPKCFSDAFDYHSLDTVTVLGFLDDVLGAEDAGVKLGTACERYGIPLTNAHSALADITATLALYKALRQCVRDLGVTPLPPPMPNRFLVEVDGVWCYAAGKHKGKPVRGSDSGYRAWVLREVKLRDEERAVLQAG